MTPQQIAKLVNYVMGHLWLMMSLGCSMTGHWPYAIGAVAYAIYLLV